MEGQSTTDSNSNNAGGNTEAKQSEAEDLKQYLSDVQWKSKLEIVANGSPPITNQVLKVRRHGA